MTENQFANQTCMNLETYRNSGKAVQTPVWFYQDGDLFYFRTLATSGKIKRLHSHPEVRIAPCQFDGTLLGEWRPAQWEPVDEHREEHLLACFNQKYAAEIAAITSREMQEKLLANKGFAVRLLPAA